jgi:hypothetical protein
MSQPYIHIPFEGSYSIRVLFLEPEPNYDAPLRCSLAELPLDPAPEYSALSYAWDAQHPSCPVQCNGGVLRVTPNCESALRRLRHGQDVQKLWIDSICIDQTSTSECSQQVALMGEIYKRAQQVVVWLGEGDSRTELAMQRLLDIGQVGSKQDKAHMTSTLSLIFGTGVRNSSEDSLGPVFERSWFYGVWTVQEVTLPLVENIVVRCGSIAFPWIFLLMAVNYLKITKYRWGKWNEATHLQKYISGFLMDKRQDGFRGIFDYEPNNVNSYQGILQILASARAKEATKPEDKIFALFGVMKELGVDLPLPDYQKPLEQVYTEAAIACISHDRCLHILFEAHSDNRHSKLPSWVPDWSDAGWRSSDPRKAQLRKGFQAAGSTSPLWRFSPDQRRLLLSGRLVDSIHHRGAPLELDSEFDLGFLLIASGKLEFPEFLRKIHPTFGVLRSWVDISSQYKEYPTGETVQIALRHTLVDGEVRQASNSPTESAFDAWHNIMTSSDVDSLSPLVAKLQAVPPRSVEKPNISDTDRRTQLGQFPAEWRSFLSLATSPATEYHFEVLRHALRKCFFSTTNGYFGMAAGLVEQGDMIAVLAGLETPMVLRKVDQGYHFITHAYVHGIMYGEAWLANAEIGEIILV